MRTKNESNKLAKECIVTALIELMKVRDYASITITDLTKKAGVSRMAYYRNYTSKEDIISKFADEVGASIHEKLASLLLPYFYNEVTRDRHIFDKARPLASQLVAKALTALKCVAKVIFTESEDL